MQENILLVVSRKGLSVVFVQDYVGPRRPHDGTERHTDILLESYHNLNSFLCAYIDRSLPTHQYFIRNRYFLEKIFNYEFQIGMGAGFEGLMDSLFFVGK